MQSYGGIQKEEGNQHNINVEIGARQFLGNVTRKVPGSVPGSVPGDVTRKRTIRQYFTKEEDERLVELVSTIGKQWKEIEEVMGKKARQCRDRYNNYLNPTLTKREWTGGEEEELVRKVNEKGTKWSKIVQFFPGRSPVDISKAKKLFEQYPSP